MAERKTQTEIALDLPAPAGLPVTPKPLPADAACRGCGRKILWAESVKSGKPTPLDPGVHMAVVFTRRDGVRCCQNALDYWWGLCQMVSRQQWDGVAATLLGMEGFALSHFANCPKANDFSGPGKVLADHRRRMADALRRVAGLLSGPARTIGVAECREIAALCLAAADNTPEVTP